MAYRHKDISIDDFSSFQKYIEYEEVRNVISRQQSGTTKDTIMDIIEKTTVGKEKILKIINHYNAPEKLLQREEYLKMFPFRNDMPNEDMRCIDVKEICIFLVADREDEIRIEEIVNSVNAYIPVPELHLTITQAYELILFYALFAYVLRTPKNDDITSLKGHLNLNGCNYSQSNPKIYSIWESPDSLPGFQKHISGQPLNLELRVIVNQTKDSVLVIVENSPLQRHLDVGEKILALTVDGNVVTFLPRIAVMEDGEHLITFQDGKDLVFEKASGRTPDRVPYGGGKTIFFSQGSEGGYARLLVADEDGKYLGSKLERITVPTNVRWLQGDIEDCGFVTSDGCFKSVRSGKSWEQILFFDLGAGNGIAVNGQREAIDNEGNILCADAAAVSCFAERWIVLQTDGSVVTDQGKMENLDAPVRAVCADADGYWIATDKNLLRRGKYNWSNPEKFEELVRNNTGDCVCGITADGRILRIRERRDR